MNWVVLHKENSTIGGENALLLPQSAMDFGLTTLWPECKHTLTQLVLRYQSVQYLYGLN